MTEQKNSIATAKMITKAVERLSTATAIEDITHIVAQAARELTGADGATFVLREDDKCYYANEDAISPLWKGQRFSETICISGWSMIHGTTVSIPDIYQDDRIPHEAYLPTFVKSLCMVPIRAASPIGAIGNYWKKQHHPTHEEVKHLQTLANSAAVAVENWELKHALGRRNSENSQLQNRHKDLELNLHTLIHDLRNPVASMMALTDLLRMQLDPNLDSEALSYFHEITKVGRRFHQTIAQMLALYKMTNQEISKQNVDLSLMGQEIELSLRAQTPRKDLRVNIDSDMKAKADPILMRLALENLFGNAFKFTSQREEPLIHFGCMDPSQPKRVYFLRDNGAGFEASQAHRLFQPMSRLHSSDEFEGTGLGLASVARIVDAHGGSVRAEGRKGQGATIYFSLPAQ